MGAVLTVALSLAQRPALLAVGNAAGLPFSLPYLRWRLPGMIPDAFALVAFAAFRGMLDTVTPLKVRRRL